MTSTHRPLPVPRALLDLYLQLTIEDGWISAYNGPTGSELDRYCGPDGKLADVEGLQAADRTATEANLASLRRAADPYVATVLDDLADQMEADGMTEASEWLRERAGVYRGGGG